MMKYIGVIGGGAWGTSLASIAAANGSKTTLWAREPKVVQSINTSHENVLYLKNVALPHSLVATQHIDDLKNCDIILLVTPAQHTRSMCEALTHFPASTPLVICSKGIEASSLKLMHEVVSDTLKNPIAVLSGPTFADEMAKGLPVSMSIASKDAALCDEIKALMQNETVSLFPLSDIIGAQIGGAMKNVIAIASGMVEGAQLGHNARAAIITKGLDEMREVCVAKGGEAETMRALCGLGDLLLTCTSEKSRNMSLGLALGKGEALSDILANRHTVAEGYHSAVSTHKLALSLGLKLPLCEAVYHALHENMPVEEALKRIITAS